MEDSGTRKPKPDKGRNWPYFTDAELASPDVGYAVMYGPFMDLLVELRRRMDMPLQVTSGYRTRKHNKKIGGASSSAHLYGCAVDIAIGGKVVYQLVKIAMELGFTGIHVKNHGPMRKRFVHLDYITGAQVPKRLVDSRPYLHTYAA